MIKKVLNIFISLLKNVFFVILGLICGLAISSFISSVYGDILESSTNATYSNSKLSATNVQDALDEIYDECIPISTRLFGSAVLDTEAGVDFSKTSKQNGTNGVYILSGTENDTYPIYYYRGGGTDTTTGEELVKNNLIFADTCWKIVRTTSTGGLRLIYNGVPTDGECNNTGTASQLSSTSKFNSSYSSPAYVGYMYGTRYTYTNKTLSSDTTKYVFGNTATYSGGKYTLSNTLTTTGTWSSDYKTLNNNHYTCFTTGTTCTSLYYVYYTNSSTAYYITLTGGTMVEGAITAMFDTNPNQTDSTIKTAIDNWYNQNISGTSYESKIDKNEIFCNDRSIYALNGWNPNGGSTTSDLYFGAYGRLHTTPAQYTPIVTCPRDIDKFTATTASTGNKALTYPVGLLTADEIVMAGAEWSTDNSSYYLYTRQIWWAGSPYIFYSYNAHGFNVNYGSLYSGTVDNTYGVRPVVSLASGYTISDGDGSTTNPFIIN